MKRLALAFVLGLLVAPALTFAQSLPAPVVPPIETHTTVTQQLVAPPPDPKVVSESAVESSQAILVQIIAPTPVQWANGMLGLPDVWRTTPPDLSYNNPTIRGLAEQIRLAAFVLIALAVFGMGASHAMGGGQPMRWGRLFAAVVLSVGNLVWWQIGIDINNAINTVISAPDMAGLLKPQLQLPTASPTDAAASAVPALLLIVVYAVVALLTLFTLLMRLGLIDVLIACGSLFLLGFALEQTESWAMGYVRVAAGLVFSQVLIVIGLKTASVISSLGTGVVGVLLGIVVLLLIRGLPGLLSGMQMPGTHAGVIGRLIQFAVLKRIAR
ncbi:MAG: hypothetical protein V4529_17425 [Gemmatimonadota bacterium]